MRRVYEGALSSLDDCVTDSALPAATGLRSSASSGDVSAVRPGRWVRLKSENWYRIRTEHSLHVALPSKRVDERNQRVTLGLGQSRVSIACRPGLAAMPEDRFFNVACAAIMQK